MMCSVPFVVKCWTDCFLKEKEINVSGRYCKDLCYFPNDGLVNLCVYFLEFIQLLGMHELVRNAWTDSCPLWWWVPDVLTAFCFWFFLCYRKFWNLLVNHWIREAKKKHLLTENAKEKKFLGGKVLQVFIHASNLMWFIVIFGYSAGIIELMLSSRGWNIVEFWGEAKHQNQNETLGVLERRKVFVWTRT